MPDLRYVRGEGTLDAKLMIIGEAPGGDEERDGRPFVGASGRLLNKLIAEAGTNRSQCYVTNIVKVRPPNNKFERLREYGLSPVDFLPELWQEIQAVQPNCILALGKHSLKYLTGRSGKNNSITENRGSILPLVSEARHRCKVVATYHPAHLLHMHGGEIDDPRVKLWMEYDFKRAVEESLDPEFNLPKRQITVGMSSHDTYRFIHRHRDFKRVSVDCEVLNAVPTVLGLSFDPSEAYAIPLLDFTSAIFNGRMCSSARDVADSLRTIFNYLSQPDIQIVGQNFKFDHDKVAMLGAVIRARIIDIMLIHATIYPEFPKSLEFMASIRTREPYWKNDDMYKRSLRDLCVGCGRDAAVALEIALDLLPELEEAGLRDFYWGFPKNDWRYPFCVERLHNLYRKMDHVGFKYDRAKNKELKEKYIKLVSASQIKLNMLCDAEINVNSPKQVAYLLYDHLKLPKRGKEGRGTGEDVLVALMNSPQVKNEEHRQIMQLILETRRLRKVIGTYLEASPDFDGRMRTSYKIVGTETGRTSTEQQKPPIRPTPMGLAYQTISKHGELGPDIRKQFVADDGYVFMQADSRQAEARVVFLLAKNYEGLKRMDDPNYDIHAHTASWFNPGMTMEILKKDKLRRFSGKKIRHAGNYDMQKGRAATEYNNDAKRFGLDAQISEWKAGQLLEIFHANDPSIKEVFHEEVREVLDSTKILVSPFGRRREFFGNPDDHGFYKEGYAHIPQASVADNTKRAMLGISDEVQDIRFILEWHDGFLALVPKNETELYGRLFIDWMEKPIDFAECSLPRGELVIPCELEISYTTFYDLKTYELDRHSVGGH